MKERLKILINKNNIGRIVKVTENGVCKFCKEELEELKNGEFTCSNCNLHYSQEGYIH